MEALQLTEKQKEMLLEMAKNMFPEYKYFRLHDGTCDLCTEGTLDFAEKEKPPYNSWHRINWFEFCLMYLAPQIMPPFAECKNFYSGLIGHREMNSYNKHPIDYLYQEFKKVLQ